MKLIYVPYSAVVLLQCDPKNFESYVEYFITHGISVYSDFPYNKKLISNLEPWELSKSMFELAE